MRYKVSHTTTYSYSDAVPICHNEVRLTPRDHSHQICLTHRLSVRPNPTSMERATDYFGNQVHFFTVQEGHQRLFVTALSKVKVMPRQVPLPSSTPPWETVRDWLAARRAPTHLESVQYLYDSPFIRTNDELLAYAEPSFSAGRPWLECLLDLTQRIYDDYTYDPTATNLRTPLEEAMQLKRGVCQDFAHLQIGCVRALGLSARYVSGYLLTEPPPGKPRLIGADASHAWMGAYCPEIGWIEFDPTNNQIPSVKHVTLAWGRDYYDVCPIKGVFLGGGKHAMTVSVDVLPLDQEAA
ncbi:MAG: transglutaminase family protein [Planctomycetota bacterium]|nr:transglutaminase family protein [Planctomycetota bacterium]